jgi:hypothetical protein
MKDKIFILQFRLFKRLGLYFLPTKYKAKLLYLYSYPLITQLSIFTLCLVKWKIFAQS